MKKEYILPISCNTTDKIKSVIYWSIRIGLTLLFGILIYQILSGTFDRDHVIVFPAVTASLIFTWLITFVSWEYKLPRFRCRCD